MDARASHKHGVTSRRRHAPELHPPVRPSEGAAACAMLLAGAAETSEGAAAPCNAGMGMPAHAAATERGICPCQHTFKALCRTQALFAGHPAAASPRAHGVCICLHRLVRSEWASLQRTHHAAVAKLNALLKSALRAKCASLLPHAHESCPLDTSRSMLDHIFTDFAAPPALSRRHAHSNYKVLWDVAIISRPAFQWRYSSSQCAASAFEDSTHVCTQLALVLPSPRGRVAL